MDHVLHFRYFDAGAKMVIDTDENTLPQGLRPGDDVKQLLKNLWPPHELTKTEAGQVLLAIKPFLGYTVDEVLGLPWNGFHFDDYSSNKYFETQNYWTETWDKKVPHVIEMLEKEHEAGKVILNWTSTAGGYAGTPWHSMGKNQDILNYLLQREADGRRPGGSRSG